MSDRVLANVTCVSVAGSGLLIEGPPGSGKSRLALALIDRGAVLVGDDGIRLEHRGTRVWACPPPNIAGRIEIRGVGITELQATCAPLCLALLLGEGAARLPTLDPTGDAGGNPLGVSLPRLAFPAFDADPVRAEWALRLHGLPLPNGAPTNPP